jgi:hypothetical protein
MIQNFYNFQKYSTAWVSKNAEFDADFESVENVAKKVINKKYKK